MIQLASITVSRDSERALSPFGLSHVQHLAEHLLMPLWTHDEVQA